MREALARCLGASSAGIDTGRLTTRSLRESNTAGRAVSPPPACAGRLALLVEDNAIDQKVGSALLAKMGSTVHVAGDGLEATDADRQKCLDAGMDDYLSKPVSLQNLSSVIKRRLSPDS
jgi:hypothetical protein